MSKRIIGLDPGNEQTGMVILESGLIIGAHNLPNTALFDKITGYSLHKELTIVIEDIKPFSVKMSQQVIDTCKFIGVLVYRLSTVAGLKVELVTRYEVKSWIFATFGAVCEPLIDIKIEKKRYEACDMETKQEIRVNGNGTTKKRKGSFIYVDDKMVMESMKVMYQIKKPLPGKGYEHGLQTHSFQALGAASFFMTKR